MSAKKIIKKAALAAIATGIIIVASGSSNASDRGATAAPVDRAAPFMTAYGESLPPIGFVNFCREKRRENRAECQRSTSQPVRVVMTDERWAEMMDINVSVNREIEPISDQDLYKVIEYWTYPTNRGDCEDFVLLKKRRLIALGWPPSALLITVLRDENGDGHAILTVSTDLGDYILDNRKDEVLPWQDTPYSYIKRQSQSNSRVWVSLKRRSDPRHAVLPDTARFN